MFDHFPSRERTGESVGSAPYLSVADLPFFLIVSEYYPSKDHPHPQSNLSKERKYTPNRDDAPFF